MVRISTGIGSGGSTQQGAPQPQGEWRQPQQFARAPEIDWTKPEMATPHPSRSQRFGRRRVQPITDVPQLPEREINVKAKGLGTYYTLDGMPIAGDQWVRLPISPGLIQAVKDGNLERGPDPVSEPPRSPSRRHAPAE